MKRLLLAGILVMMACFAGGAAAGELPAAVQAAADEIRDRQNHAGRPFVVVSIDQQRLYLFRSAGEPQAFPVSTSRFGVGSEAGSNKTPTGLHRVAHKFGDGAPRGMVFKARRATGEVVPLITEPKDVPEDLVTTRILWLEGLQSGLNRGQGVDSFRRYIYIHGTQEEGLVGQPASHGCVRMLNDDVIRVFERLPEGALVSIIR